MSDTESDYKVGPDKPPLHTRFKKGQSGNPRGRQPKELPELLVAALNQPVTVTDAGRPRQITKREAVIAQLVDKSAGADLCATKMLLDILKDIEKQARPARRPSPLRSPTPTRRWSKTSSPGCAASGSSKPPPSYQTTDPDQSLLFKRPHHRGAGRYLIRPNVACRTARVKSRIMALLENWILSRGRAGQEILPAN
jgi:Family of unknown function (DUF5681)